jgi:hypothetical protein
MGKKFSRCIRTDTLGTADKEYVTATRLQGILPFSMFRSLAAAATDGHKNKHCHLTLRVNSLLECAQFY